MVRLQDEGQLILVPANIQGKELGQLLVIQSKGEPLGKAFVIDAITKHRCICKIQCLEFGE